MDAGLRMAPLSIEEKDLAMVEDPTTEQRVRIVHPVKLAEPIVTGIYFGFGFMIASALVAGAAFLVFGRAGRRAGRRPHLKTGVRLRGHPPRHPRRHRRPRRRPSPGARLLPGLRTVRMDGETIPLVRGRPTPSSEPECLVSIWARVTSGAGQCRTCGLLDGYCPEPVVGVLCQPGWVELRGLGCKRILAGVEDGAIPVVRVDQVHPLMSSFPYSYPEECGLGGRVCLIFRWPGCHCRPFRTRLGTVYS